MNENEKYLCGCTIASKANYCFHLLPTLPGQDAQFTSNRFDDQGFMVCPQHGMRLGNWRTIPKSENHPGPKTGYMSMSALEIERRRLFGKPIPKSRALKLNFDQFDIRDTRDPLEMADFVKSSLVEIRAGSNGHTN